MLKKILAVGAGAFILSGCSLNVPVPGGLSSTGGSVWKSFDGGQTFAPKATIDEKRRISSADVLAFAFHPTDPQIIYIGTLESGLFRTTDGAEHWEPIVFPPTRNYGLAIDQSNGDRIYASGVYEGIAKMYRSDDAGKNWKEIYTEPGTGTVITALGSNPDVPNTLYAGTSAGVIIKSTNGGETWDNVVLAKDTAANTGAITKVLFERGSPDKVTLLVFNQGALVSTNGGKAWSDYSKNIYLSSPEERRARPESMTTIVADPALRSVLYAGAKNGLFRSRDSGKSWEALDIIESSKAFSIRSVAISPANSNEIVYASGNAFYKSTDGGKKWATTQLEIDRGVSVIEYDPAQPGMIYFALRKF